MSDLLFRGPGGSVLLRDVVLEAADGALRLQATLDPETWARIDTAGAFQLAPEARGPTMFGTIPREVPVRLEAEAGDELRAWFGDRGLDEVMAELEGAHELQFPRHTEAWPALNVTWEHSPGLRVGFSTTRSPSAEVGAIRAAVADGRSPTAGLEAGWDDLADRRPALHALAAWAAVAREDERDALLDWLAERSMTQDFWEVLLHGWPPWVRARARRVVSLACNPGGAWPKEQHGIVERRLDEARCRGEWAGYLVNNHLYDGGIAGVGDAVAAGPLPATVVSTLAMAVATWAKDLLVDASRAMARGGPVGRAQWRLALAKWIPGEDPRWAEIGAALDNPLPAVEVYDRGFD